MQKNLTINEIYALSEEEAKKMSAEYMQIKEHSCYFTDLGEYFGYSVLVYKNGRHVYHADDFELHNSYTMKHGGRAALTALYVKMLNAKLFTDAELYEPVSSYDDYRKKDYFVRNLRIMRYDHISAFYITKNQQEDIDRRRTEYPVYDRITFSYVKDEAIAKESLKINEHLENGYRSLLADDDAFRETIYTELANHEAGYTGRYDEGLATLGMTFDGLSYDRQVIVTEELEKLMKETA